ncbi:MAG: sigma-70 family RNA polymerase sigma factor [Bacteroidota bacterium]
MQPTDRQLLIRARAGDQPAFADLYRRYGARLTAYFLPRLGYDAARAEDLRQQVFLQLLESKAFREADAGPEDLSSLLFTIAANLLKNTYRSDERRLRREQAYREIRRADPEPPGETRVLPQQLDRALGSLPDHQRTCVELRFRRGYTIQEIAEALDCSPGTVKSRLHYGLKRLADLLKTANID